MVRFVPVNYSWRMSTRIMEQTLAELQRRVERLEGKRRPAAEGGWRSAFGFAKGDKLFREAMKRGAKWRQKANREGR